MPLADLATLDDYLRTYGRVLAYKVVSTLDPLHLPGRDPVPSELDTLLRTPFEPQKHTIAASVKMMDEAGSGFIVGEMGTGKSLIGCSAVHAHASRSVRQGGSNGKYRALILCPDHLISKWKREIEDTIPGAIVTTFEKSDPKKANDSWTVVARLAERKTPQDFASEVRHGARWCKPEGPEWYIIGRDQSKFYPDWDGVSFGCAATKVVGTAPKRDEDGKYVYKKNGRQVLAKLTDTVYLCPRCGSIVRDKQGLAVDSHDLSKKQYQCKAKMLRQVSDSSRECGRDVLPVHGNAKEDIEVGKTVTIGKLKYKVEECGERLWNYTAKPNRWPPARIIQKQLKGFFKYLIIDECFPGWTKVATPQGPRRIDEIIPGDDVCSFKDGEIVTRKVTRAIAKPTKTGTRDMVLVTTETSSFVCTPNHRIFDRDLGYVSAADLTHGSRVATLENSDGPEGAWGASLRGVWEGDRTDDPQREGAVLLASLRKSQAWDDGYSPVFALRDFVRGAASESDQVLLQELLHEAPVGNAGDESKVRGVYDPEVASPDRRRVGSHEAHEQGLRLQSQGGRGQEGEAVCGHPWRQRVNHPRAADTGRVFGIRGGVSAQDGEPLMEMLEIRPRESGPEGGGRSRWAVPQDYRSDGPGRSQEGHGRSVGVAAAPGDERGCPGELGGDGSAGPGLRVGWDTVIAVDRLTVDVDYVYDLEIEDTHRYFAEGVLVSNCHEQKSDESAQSMAAGKLMASTKHTLALTGTLIGGYANHLYPLMIRMTPETLREEGFEWGKDMPFNQCYGRVDRIVTTSHEGDSEVSVGKRVKSMRRCRTGKSNTRYAVRPGVMPTLFGRHLIGSSLFITLEEMADELPELDEQLIGVDMDQELRGEYDRIECELVYACKELLRNGSMKLLGAMLQTLLAYPDRPYDWEPEHDGTPAVGYYKKPRLKTADNWEGVVQPADLDRVEVRPKEQALLDICEREIAEGRQVWIGCQLTGKRDVQPRLRSLLESRGIRTAILHRDTVPPRDREKWIEKNGAKHQVVLSHPKLVETGLDFFSKRPGGHNFSTIILYETGYNAFTMRQFSRRSWRIGQSLPCRVYYLYYKGTMQHRAMELIAKKVGAAQALEGELSSEGLVAMAGADNAQMALARSLSEQIDDSSISRNWGRVPTRKAKPPVPSLAVNPHEGLPARSELQRAVDELPDEVVLATETVLQAQDKARVTPGLKLVGTEDMTRAQLARLWNELSERGELDLDDLFDYEED